MNFKMLMKNISDMQSVQTTSTIIKFPLDIHCLIDMHQHQIKWCRWHFFGITQNWTTAVPSCVSHSVNQTYGLRL